MGLERQWCFLITFRDCCLLQKNERRTRCRVIGDKSSSLGLGGVLRFEALAMGIMPLWFRT